MHFYLFKHFWCSLSRWYYMIYLFLALQKLQWKHNSDLFIYLLSITYFIIPLSLSEFNNRDPFFHFQGFKSWKANGEKNGWSQESSSLCLRYTSHSVSLLSSNDSLHCCHLSSPSAALNVMIIQDFQCYELNMGFTDVLFPPIKLHLCAVKSPCLSRCHNGAP